MKNLHNYSLNHTFTDIKKHQLSLYHYHNNQCIVRPCLSMTLMFKHGARDYVRQGLSQLFDKMMAEYGEYLKFGYYGDNRPAKKTSRGLTSLKKYIIESPKVELESSLSNASNKDEAPEYSFDTFTKGERTEDGYHYQLEQVIKAGHDGGLLSTVKVILPIEFLSNQDKLETFESLLAEACELLPVFAGYAGLSLSLPFDDDRYLPQEYATATQFSGLDIDTLWYLYKDDYRVLSLKGESPNVTFHPYEYVEEGRIEDIGYIKNVTWINIIPKVYFERIGGYEANKHKLERDDINITDLGESVIIKAGDSPQLGSPEQGLPESYVFVNKVLKHLRDPTPDALQYDLGGVENANEENSKSWQARFDIEDEEIVDSLIKNQTYYDQQINLDENQSVEVEGYYKDPATKKLIYLKKGDIAPSYPLDKNGNRSQVYIWHKLTSYGVSQINNDLLQQVKNN